MQQPVGRGWVGGWWGGRGGSNREEKTGRGFGVLRGAGGVVSSCAECMCSAAAVLAEGIRAEDSSTIRRNWIGATDEEYE